MSRRCASRVCRNDSPTRCILISDAMGIFPADQSRLIRYAGATSFWARHYFDVFSSLKASVLRAITSFRVAAGLEDPSAAEALR
jgi:hypothetical protein